MLRYDPGVAFSSNNETPTPSKSTRTDSQSRQNLNTRLLKRGVANKPASDFDNFYTPDNSFFYSNSPYQSLDASRQEIRLLRLFPKKSYHEHIKANSHWARPISTDGHPVDDEAIADLIIQYKQYKGHDNPVQVLKHLPILGCEIVDKVALSRKSGAYSILSYCAGDPRETDVVLVDGIPFNVFSNLGHALEFTLLAWTSQNPGKELLLWVDQICINQQDHAERGAQVAIMRDIYRRSRESFVCLSNPKLKKCLQWADAFRNPLDSVPTALGKHNFTMKSMFDSWWELSIGANMSREEWMESLKAFMASPLWCRSWIYQELVVSSQPYLISDTECVSWADILPALEFLSYGAEHLDTMISLADFCLNEKNKSLDQEHSLDLKSYKAESQACSEFRQIVRANTQGMITTIGRQLDSWKNLLVTDVRILQSDIQFAADQLKNQPSEELSYRLRKIVEYLSHHISVKFAMMEKLKRSSLQFGEYVELLDAFWETTSAKSPWDPPTLTEGTSDLHAFLEAVKSDTNSRGAFYNPNDLLEALAVSLTHSLLKEPQKPQRGSAESYQSNLTSLARFQSSLKSLDGRAVYSVLQCKNSTRWTRDLKVHLQHSRSCKASDPRDRVYAFVGLADKHYGIVPDYTNGNTVVHVMIDAAQKIIQHEDSLAILQYTGQGREHLGHFLPSWVPDWSSRYVDCGLKNYTSTLVPDPKQRKFDAAKGIPASARFKEDSTDSSNLDLNVKGVLCGMLDEVKGPVPEFPDLRMFSTSDGQKIITSTTALLDDEVWVLHGASMPVLLRPEGKRYSFLHEVVVCDEFGAFSETMFGGMIDLAAQGLAETKPVWIM